MSLLLHTFQRSSLEKMTRHHVERVLALKAYTLRPHTSPPECYSKVVEQSSNIMLHTLGLLPFTSDTSTCTGGLG